VTERTLFRHKIIYGFYAQKGGEGMSEYGQEELSALVQNVAAIVFMSAFVMGAYKYFTIVPWLTIIGVAVGLGIIIMSWAGKKNAFFVGSLILMSIVLVIYHNFSSIF